MTLTETKYISSRTVLSYIAFGSNIAPRQHFIEKALQLLQARAGTLLALSRLIETEAEGFFAEQFPPHFLNGVCKLETKLNSQDLLEVCQVIEAELGRKKAGKQGYQSRTIDLDLILHGNTVLESQSLTLPHQRYRQRGFVLLPLSEVLEPNWQDPETGENIDQLLAGLSRIESSANWSSWTLAGA